MLKKQKLIETMRKLTKDLQQKINQFNQQQIPSQNTIKLSKKTDPKIHEFVCYQDS